MFLKNVFVYFMRSTQSDQIQTFISFVHAFACVHAHLLLICTCMYTNQLPSGASNFSYIAPPPVYERALVRTLVPLS